MSLTPEISILMPVKNASNWLVECVLSIQNQSFKSWELITVDDGSSDNSFDILHEFSNIDSRIKALRNTSSGIINALDLAFQNSSGVFIHRMDADDRMPIQKLDILYDLLAGRKKVVATGKVRYFSEKSISEGYLKYENWLNNINDFAAQMYRECPIASPNWLVHRECFERDIELSELQYPEDYDMVLKWHSLHYQIVKTKEVTHLWREHAQRTSRNSEVYQQESFFRLKLKHFVKNELLTGEKIQLIGAGQKGKLAEKILSELHVDLAWFAFNQSKVDSNQKLKALESLDFNSKCLLSNWPNNPLQQSEIMDFMTKKGFKLGHNFWVI